MIRSPVFAAAVPCVSAHHALVKCNLAPFAKPDKASPFKIRLSAVE
mgnify:CR=1 FL=1